MNSAEKMQKIRELLVQKKEKQVAEDTRKEATKKKFKDKDKVKKLTDKERLDRIEELLGL